MKNAALHLADYTVKQINTFIVIQTHIAGSKNENSQQYTGSNSPLHKNPDEAQASPRFTAHQEALQLVFTRLACQSTNCLILRYIKRKKNHEI